jgi:hypothetical protein
VDHLSAGKTVSLLQTIELWPRHITISASPRQPTSPDLSHFLPKILKAGVVSIDPVSGQIALAQAVLHELQASKALGWPADVRPPVIDPAACCRKFKINSSVWEYICLWGIMFYDRTYPLRYDSSHRIAMKEVFGQAYNQIHAGGIPTSVGLPNIGQPEPVAAATSKQIRGEE